MPKIARYLLPAVFFYLSATLPLYGADLDDLYNPLLKKDRFLYDGNVRSFFSKERGLHGRNPYDKFDASPYFFVSENTLLFSPLDSLNIGVIIDETFPAKYKRATYNLNNNLAALQEYELNYFRRYGGILRARMEPFELYFDYSRNWQKSRWDYAPWPASINMYNYIKATYEDADAKVRYVSNDGTGDIKSNLSKIERPLLSSRQVSAEAGIRYRRGSVDRRADYYYYIPHPQPPYIFRNFHRLRPHFETKATLGIGLLENLELESALAYTTPFESKYEYRQFNPAGTSLLITGKYKWDDNFYIPAALRYRMRENLELKFSSDFHLIHQRLEYWQKNANNTLNTFAEKEITFYNIQPAASLEYLHDAGKEIKEDEFELLTKRLLLRDQWLFEGGYKRDMSYRDMRAGNGSLNIIDPYNLYLYPLDLFVDGTEYATFLTGNLSTIAANVQPQNYHLITLGLTYGVADNVNVGLSGGYRMAASADHFTLYDQTMRSFTFKPYYFIDPLFDWKMTKNTLLSFNAHVVPYYETRYRSSAAAREYKSKESYYDLQLSLTALF